MAHAAWCFLALLCCALGFVVIDDPAQARLMTYGEWCGSKSGPNPPVDAYDVLCQRHKLCIASEATTTPPPDDESTCDAVFLSGLHNLTHAVVHRLSETGQLSLVTTVTLLGRALAKPRTGGRTLSTPAAAPGSEGPPPTPSPATTPSATEATPPVQPDEEEWGHGRDL